MLDASLQDMPLSAWKQLQLALICLPNGSRSTELFVLHLPETDHSPSVGVLC